MFNFMKKKKTDTNRYLFVKNNARDESVSSRRMSTDEYIASVEGGIVPYWVDKTLMEKTGIKDLLADNAQVAVAMSYDDAYDCLKRVMRMVDMATYVSTEFHARSEELDYLSSAEAFGKHLDNVACGETKDVFRVKHDFYSADTIRNLFIEAQEKAEINECDAPTDLDEAMKRLNGAIKSLRPVLRCTFISIECAAIAAMAEMSGFKA